MKKIMVLIILWCCGSCTPIFKVMYGIRQPEYETAASLDEKKVSLGMPPAIHCNVRSKRWKENRLLMMPEVFVFAKNRKYISYKDSLKPNCNGPAEVFLSELDPGRNYFYSDEVNLDSFLSDLECDNASFENKDFYIFITWAKWNGDKIFHDKTKNWLNALENNKRIQYELVMVNQDLQEKWSSEEKEQLDRNAKK